MKKALPLIFGFLLLAICTLAVASFHSEKRGQRLYEEYFEATPPSGYGAQRALGTSNVTDADQSILRQGINYHQAGRYDYALTSFRAYLESNPEPETYTVELLAATAAMASGEFLEGKGYLETMTLDAPAAKAAYYWYQALLELRNEDLTEARQMLEKLRALPESKDYQAAELERVLG